MNTWYIELQISSIVLRDGTFFNAMKHEKPATIVAGFDLERFVISVDVILHQQVVEVSIELIHISLSIDDDWRTIVIEHICPFRCLDKYVFKTLIREPRV